MLFLPVVGHGGRNAPEEATYRFATAPSTVTSLFKHARHEWYISPPLWFLHSNKCPPIPLWRIISCAVVQVYNVTQGG